MIEVTAKGFLTLPVTAKRHSLEPVGVSTGGPMDAVHSLLANRLVGNPDDAALLEAAFLLPGLRFSARCAFAAVGGLKRILLLREGEKISLPANQTLFALPGDELLSSPLERGMRACLAFSGGLRIKSLRPEPVSVGDRLELLPGSPSLPRRIVKEEPFVLPGDEAVLRVMEGVQLDHFSEDGLNTFFDTAYTYTPQSDRMGIRFSGQAVSFAPGRDGNILSEGILMGDIQITSSGQPILLMADCQTVGGYAKIAHVISADLPLAAQLRPGAKVSFRRVDVFEAQAALRRLYRRAEECIHEYTEI